MCIVLVLLLFSTSAETEDTMTNKPHVTGTFIQPGTFLYYSQERWSQHMEYLLEAGIDTVIVQWTAETPYGRFKSTYCPVSFQCEKETYCSEHPEFLETLLQAAQEKGMKLFVGLNLSDEWWEFACSRDDWNQKQAQIGAQMAAEIYDTYKARYPETLYGWYFSWEMFNGMYGQEDKAISFLNLYLDALNEIAPEMPIMLSPFVRSVGGPPAQAQAEWTKVFAGAHFRDGDIFCCQDAVGAEHITIEELDGYFAALKAAADTKEGLLFWANTECFRRVSEGFFNPAPVERFIRQMEIAQPYVSGYVTFAYSHYYAPDVVRSRKRHEEYLKYLAQ